MLDRLGMTPLIDAPTDELSGGQAKRVALARLLVGEHEVLILDEPTNHLDLDAIQFLEEWLAAYRGGLVLVTHDRHVLDKVTTKVLELDRGRAYLHVPTGWHAGSGYAAYLAGRAEREERAEVAEQVRKNLANTRAGVAAPGCAGPNDEAEGPHRHGHGAGRRQGPGRARATASWAWRWAPSDSARRGSSSRDVVVLVAGRHAKWQQGARPVLAGARAGRPRRRRRPERRRQVDPARPRSPAVWCRHRARWSVAPPCRSATTTNSAATSI